MASLLLIAGILLPWLCGTIWLVTIESALAPNETKNRIFQAGYGFFLGFAILYFVILGISQITGTVSYIAVMLTLATISGGGLLYLHWKSGLSWRSDKLVSTLWRERSRPQQVLMLVLILWIALHVIFAAVELLTTPLYPWDAWLVWVYRAKAWFFQADMSTVLSPAEWISTKNAGLYTVEAFQYPRFASIVPFWAATSLGYWSESLINLPVLFCGIAIGLALYGQCRSIGLGSIVALVGTYLLVSTPLFGVHMSLGGYADIWMTGFTGLGFMAMVHGLAKKDRLQLYLGLGFIALSMLVKNEGVVWFYFALLFYLFCCISFRTASIILLTTGLFIAGVLVSGVTYVELPILGGVGWTENQFSIPFIGSFLLEFHNVWQVYLQSFFTMGSWNLLWVLISTGLLFVSLARPDETSRVVLLFLLMFIATQVFIFVFSEQGRFAVSYTAVNRLPLHFLPALLFSAALIFQPFLNCAKNENESDE